MKCQKILDARKLPRAAKELLRTSAVRRVQAGESPEAVASGIGINRRQIYRWIQLATYGGEQALKARPIAGAPAKLSTEQMQKIARIVHEKNPQQLKFDYALWTLAMIRVLIRQEFNVSLSEVSVGIEAKAAGSRHQGRSAYRF
jgi:transposase